MKIIVTTKTNTIIEGKLCNFLSSIVSLDVEQLPAYKAQAIVIEGGELSQYANYVHVKLPKDMIQEYAFIDE